MSSQFIQSASSADVEFVVPRQVQVSDAATPHQRRQAGAFWRGTMVPVVGRDKDSLIGELARLDALGNYFLADLNNTDPALPAASWIDTASNSATHVRTFDKTLRVGQLVSIRSSQAPNYPTARIITGQRVEADGSTGYELNKALPTEFIYPDPANRLQYCVNRAHVRAVYKDNPLRWNRSPRVIALNSFDWYEDIGTTIAELAKLAREYEAGLSEQELLTESGDELTTETGDVLQIDQ